MWSNSTQSDEEPQKITAMDHSARKMFLENGFRGVSNSKDKHAIVSSSFFDNEESWKRYSSDYAVLTTISHHSGEMVGRPPSNTPTLSFGTVIENGDEILLCIQPACDTVRLRHETGFLFLKLIHEDSEFDLVLPNADGGTRYQIAEVGKFRHLRELRTLRFKPRAGCDVILAQKDDREIYHFTAEDAARWDWRAQLRERTAINLAQRALNTIGRIGSNEFEWLRTSAK